MIFVFALVLLLALAMIPVGLPGTWVMVAAAVGLGFASPAVHVGWVVIAACVVIAIIAEALDIVLAARYTKRYGGSRRGAWGAFIGGIVGALGTGILVNPALGGAGIMDYTAIPPKVADYDFAAQMVSQIWGVCTTLVWSGVGSAILQVLQSEHSLDDETAKIVGEAVKKRIRDEATNPENQAETAAAKVAKLEEVGRLTEDAILQAAEQGQRGFVAEALALKGEVPVVLINKIIESRSGKAMTAAAWRAGLSARGAMKLQQLAARVPANSMIHARDGVKYALSDAEMDWFLTYFAEQAGVAA